MASRAGGLVMPSWVLYILSLVALPLATVFITRISNQLIHTRRLKKYDGYRRDLNQSEIDWLENAKAELLQLREDTKTYPKWYGWFLKLAFLPTMLLWWGILFVLAVMIGRVFKPYSYSPADAVLVETGGAMPVVGFIFVGILLAGWSLYWLILRSNKLSNYVALKSDISGYDVDAIHNSQILLLAHHMRARIVSPFDSFDAERFLRGRNLSYASGFLTWAKVTFVLTAFLFIFDLKYFRALYPDHIASSGPYFSLGQIETLSFLEISKVELRCHISKGNMSAKYILFIKGKELVRFDIDNDTIDSIYELDLKLRDNKTIIQAHAKKKSGVVKRHWLQERCVDRIVEEHSLKADKVNSIFHRD